MTARRIHHVAERPHWDAALAAGTYSRSTRGLALDEVGFIHCSNADQVAGVVARFYEGVPDLVLLTIDAGAPGVAEVLVDEAVAGTAERFPHLYGPLPVAAALEVRDLPGLDLDRLDLP